MLGAPRGASFVAVTETAPPPLSAVLPAWLSDVIVEIAPIAPTLAGQTESGVLWRAAPGRFLLDVPDIARYLVAGGRSITVDPRPHAAPGDVVRFMRATALGALCYQRGMAVFHAATAARCGDAVML